MTSITRFLKKVTGIFEVRAAAFVSYFNIVFFFEIINLMVLLFLLFGKITAVLTGFALALLLSWHIIMLFFKKQRHRKIQLFLMDIHVPVSAGILIRMITSAQELSLLQELLLVVRCAVILMEVLLIYLLTEDDIIASFHSQ